MANRKEYLMLKSKQTNKNKKAFLKALEEVLGNISQASVKAGISRMHVYQWKKDDEEFAKAIREIQEEYSIDYVESKMIKKINEGESSMIMFYLNNKGQHRGYGVQRNTQQNSGELTIRLVGDDD